MDLIEISSKKNYPSETLTRSKGLGLGFIHGLFDLLCFALLACFACLAWFHRFIGSWVHRFIGSWVHGFIGSQAHRFIGVQAIGVDELN